MLKFTVHFKTCPPLHCQLYDNDLSEKYYKLLNIQYQTDSNPIFRDPQLYTLQHFATLARQASDKLGWDWIRSKYNLQITTQLHKDLEKYLENGFEHIPAEHDHLLHELHYALHAIESGSKRNHWLQIEWFNDNGFSITENEYPAKLNLEFGDIRLQNPYVGHHPLYVYEQQDNINILQTCKFHDFVKPGVNIVIKNIPKKLNWNTYINWFQTFCPEFVQHHGVEKLKKFTGHPVVGKVQNLDDLTTVLKRPSLEFEKLTFD